MIRTLETTLISTEGRNGLVARELLICAGIYEYEFLEKGINLKFILLFVDEKNWGEFIILMKCNGLLFEGRGEYCMKKNDKECKQSTKELLRRYLWQAACKLISQDETWKKRGMKAGGLKMGGGRGADSWRMGLVGAGVDSRPSNLALCPRVVNFQSGWNIIEDLCSLSVLCRILPSWNPLLLPPLHCSNFYPGRLDSKPLDPSHWSYRNWLRFFLGVIFYFLSDFHYFSHYLLFRYYLLFLYYPLFYYYLLFCFFFSFFIIKIFFKPKNYFFQLGVYNKI